MQAMPAAYDESAEGTAFSASKGPDAVQLWTISVMTLRRRVVACFAVLLLCSLG